MRGREVFMQNLVAHGVRHIFGNPGTTENPLLDSLIDYPSMDYVVHLHEGIAVGAASYYARATGLTGVVSLHAAPGLGNGIGMIYNALRANAQMVVTAGQQDTRMLRREPLLAHDLAAMAAPVTKWSTQVQCADEMDEVMRRAFKIANDPPCGPVFVSLPVDVMEQQTDNGPIAPGRLYREAAPDARALATSRRRLADALFDRAKRVAAALACGVFARQRLGLRILKAGISCERGRARRPRSVRRPERR